MATAAVRESTGDDDGWEWPPAATRLLIILTVLLGHLALWIQPSADPARDRGIESRVITDGLAPLDAARFLSGELGAPAVDPLQAPLVTLPHALLFQAVGVQWGAFRIFAGAASLVLAFVAAEMLRRRFGATIAVLGAMLFCFHGAQFAWARSPTLIPLVQLSAFLLLALGARREKSSPWLALCLTSMASALIHPTIAFIAPALMIEGVRRSPSVREFLNGMPFLAMSAACLTVVLAPLSLPEDFRRTAVEGLLGPAVSSAPPLWAVVPLALPLAWVGFLVFLAHAGGGGSANRSFERLLHGAVWLPLALRASVGHWDAAACAELIPAILWLACATIAREVRRSERAVLPLLGARGSFACFGFVLGSVLLIAEAGPVFRGTVPVIGLPALFSGLVVTIAFTGRRHGIGALRQTIVLGALIFPGIWESARVLGHPQFTVMRANAEMAGSLLPTARVSGDWARALTVGNDLGWDPVGELEGAEEVGEDALVVTHRLATFEDLAEGDGTVLSEPSVLGRRMVLWRPEGTGAAPSLFEEGILAASDGEDRVARKKLFAQLRAYPEHAPSWETIAATLIRDGERIHAYRCLLNALQGSPHSVRVRQGLAALYLEAGYLPEAEYHLQAIGSPGTAVQALSPIWRQAFGEEIR